MNALPQFSHIYYEHGAAEYALAHAARTHYRHTPQTEITHYADIFNRKNQHFQIQKRTQVLILAVAQNTFLYSGTERIRSFGLKSIHYTDQMRNCVYNCSYCFLQGMHRSAHCVLFVNEKEYHDATLKELHNQGSLNLSISYLSDLLAVEHILPICRSWIKIARDHPRLQIEIRTKSNNIKALQGLTPTDNISLTWSLTPRRYAQQFEHGTASLPNRLMSARHAIDLGWRVTLCFDPIIIGTEWRAEYRQLLQETFARLPANKIAAISYGTFRMHSDYFARMFNQQPKNVMLMGEYINNNAMTTHKHTTLQHMQKVFEEEIQQYYPLEKVFFVHG